jgi:hypothetical protein
MKSETNQTPAVADGPSGQPPVAGSITQSMPCSGEAAAPNSFIRTTARVVTADRSGGRRFTSAALLAGGRSSRMGGIDKTGLVLCGASLRERALAALRPQSAEQFVIGAHCGSALGVPVHADAWPGQPGPLAGIYTALLHARHNDVLIAPADAPLLPPDLLSRLAAVRAAAGT